MNLRNDERRTPKKPSSACKRQRNRRKYWVKGHRLPEGQDCVDDPDEHYGRVLAYVLLRTESHAAKVVGCSTAAFFVRLHRARRRLAKAVDHVPPSGARSAVPHVAGRAIR
jgi:DNA-directed RNA polymerase specialized sigma24 family protein